MLKLVYAKQSYSMLKFVYAKQSYSTYAKIGLCHWHRKTFKALMDAHPAAHVVDRRDVAVVQRRRWEERTPKGRSIARHSFISGFVGNVQVVTCWEIEIVLI